MNEDTVVYLQRQSHPININRTFYLSALPFDFSYRFENVENVKVDNEEQQLVEGKTYYEIKPRPPLSQVEMTMNENSKISYCHFKIAKTKSP